MSSRYDYPDPGQDPEYGGSLQHEDDPDPEWMVVVTVERPNWTDTFWAVSDRDAMAFVSSFLGEDGKNRPDGETWRITVEDKKVA